MEASRHHSSSIAEHLLWEIIPKIEEWDVKYSWELKAYTHKKTQVRQ